MTPEELRATLGSNQLDNDATAVRMLEPVQSASMMGAPGGSGLFDKLAQQLPAVATLMMKPEAHDILPQPTYAKPEFS